MSISKPKMIEKFHAISKYHRPGTKRSKTTKIVLHYTGKSEVPAINTWKYFNNNNVYASAHFIVGLEGEIYYAVPMNEIAYTSNSANSYSIGIECATTGKDDHYSDKQYKALVQLVSWLCEYYKLNPKNDIIRHYDVTKKICPRYFVNNPSKFTQFKIDCYNLKAGKIKTGDIKNCTNGKGEITKVPGTSIDKVTETKVSQTGLVNATSLNVRSGPGTNYSKIGSLKNNTKVTIVAKCSNGWLKIKYNNGYGYVSGRYIDNINNVSTNPTKWKNGDYNCKVKATANLNLRTGRGTNYSIIHTIPKGTIFEIGYVKDNWGSTWDFKGKVGYLCCDYIEKV